MHPVVAALSLEEKGYLLGAVLARTAPPECAARAGAEAGPRCAAALAALGEETRPARAAEIAALTALVRAPVPAGVERVHHDWLRERLGRESTAVVRAVAGGLAPEVRRLAADVLRARGDDGRVAESAAGAKGVAALQRAVFAGLVPLAGAGAPTTPIARELAALAPADLVRAIEARGAEVLGRSLRGAPAAVVARAATAVDERLAPIVLEAARDQRGDDGAAAREDARRIVAAAAVAAVGATAAGGGASAIGVHALAAVLRAEGGGALRAVAQRLPLEVGRRMLAAADGGG